MQKQICINQEISEIKRKFHYTLQVTGYRLQVTGYKKGPTKALPGRCLEVWVAKAILKSSNKTTIGLKIYTIY